MRLQWQGQGDCFRTCLAILLNMDRMAVPNFDSDNNETYLDKYNKWLATKGLYLTQIRRPLKVHFTFPIIAVGYSEFKPGGTHAVIWQNNHVLFNPNHKSGVLGITGEPTSYIFLREL